MCRIAQMDSAAIMHGFTTQDTVIQMFLSLGICSSEGDPVCSLCAYVSWRVGMQNPYLQINVCAVSLCN